MILHHQKIAKPLLAYDIASVDPFFLILRSTQKMSFKLLLHHT